MDPHVRDWSRFFDACLRRRLDVELFAITAELLYERSPLPGVKIARLLLRPRTAAAPKLPDPRVIWYCERLLALKRIDVSEVLAAAFQFSPSRDRPPQEGVEGSVPKNHRSRWLNPPALEEILFDRLHKLFMTGERPLSSLEAARTIFVLSKWMSAMVASHTSDSMMHAMAGIPQHPQQSSIIVREGLGLLMVSLVENAKILEVLGRDHMDDVKKSFSQSLSSFIPFLQQTSQTALQIASRLEMSQKQHGLFDKSLHLDGHAGQGPNLDVAALQLDAVMDLPALNTRAGLFVYLNSLLFGRPLTDAFTMSTYLSARYKGDSQSMITDLITAAFDVLANAMYRNEPSHVMFCLKSFLVNKVPLLIVQFSSSTFPMTAEICITEALARIDPNAFPAFSQDFGILGNNSNSLSDARQDFLNACALHGLIAANTVQRLLGETPLQGPPSTRHVKKHVLNKLKNNFESVNPLIEQLTALDGNAGAIVLALTEFISHLCDTQMTMYLKTLCNSLLKRPQALDVMLQFASPERILRPLCLFLHDWRYEDTQGEYQPVYEEFGAILVLVLAFVHRYNLSYHELGIGHDSFVAQLLERGHVSIRQDDTTEEQRKHLGNWLKGLYDSDKEALGNDVFASCRPQDFYLIVPTLFRHTVVACSAGVLSLDTAKCGLEYLQDTSLLPSLVGGLTWMAGYAEHNHRDLDVMIPLFNKLTRPGSVSGDAQAMHSAIISIVSGRLEKCLRALKQRHPNRSDIDHLLHIIINQGSYEHSVYSSSSELGRWTNSPPTTLYREIKHSVQALSQWASAAALHPTPPSYAHKQIYASLHLLGTHKTLHAILSEIRTQTEARNGAAALDVGLSIVCAPMLENSSLATDVTTSISSPRTHLNLREMLKEEFDNAASLVATDQLLAETIVRLHRRVEAFVAAIAQNQAALATAQLDMSNVDLAEVQAAQNAQMDKALNDVAAAAAAAASANPEQQAALQRSLEQHLDLSAAAAAAAAAGGLDLSGMGVAGGADMGSLGNLDLGGLGDMGMGMGMGMELDMDMGMEDDDTWGLNFNDM
ncbi:mediator of RNA polymeras-like protein II transcription subunit 5 [Westerdykella ornata]|uniref:Mediator of RNA polymerase II transcription subunit 5 n=1 Tax=Westerdykella ornata TaxID=318751 RepID=A0A6A6JAH3_WESOR|nr:mediator of RNA polymeras-like protein II transcription subunit 5 [Westerdykella ornata]KAF2273257.1 mediator of RNA polymeras-like protein II transcription subunit 5 [Westerdykella ornata]